MRKQVKAEYWTCIIGPINSKKLKDGADSPMRQAVRRAFEETTGCEDETCWSGWGSEKEKIDIVNAVWSMEETDPLYEAIKCMLRGRFE